MLKHSRVTGRMDVQRLGAGLARPGMDTRCWVSQAIALGESHVDPQHGVFVDVMLLPSQEKYTARVPADYAGNGFGFYARIHKDDQVVVAVPSGDAADGVVVLVRLWNAADLPPRQASQTEDDILLVVEPEKNLRILLSGAGQMNLETEADGRVTVKVGGNVALVKSDKIELGAEDAADKAVLDSKLQTELTRLKTELTSLKSIFDAHTHPYIDTPAGPSVTSPTSTPFPAPASPGATNSELVTINS